MAYFKRGIANKPNETIYIVNMPECSSAIVCAVSLRFFSPKWLMRQKTEEKKKKRLTSAATR